MDWDRKACSKVFRKIKKEFTCVCDKLEQEGLEYLVHLANQVNQE